MKKVSIIIMVAAAASSIYFSCQSTRGNKLKFITHKEAADTERVQRNVSTEWKVGTAAIAAPAEAPKDIPVRYGWMKDSVAKAYLNDVHLDKLIGSVQPEDDYPVIYNGFFGDDRYRIEFYFAEVKYDESNPFVMQVSGKDRFKKAVTPFSGVFTIDSVLAFKDFNFDYSNYLEYHDTNQVFEGDTFVATTHIKGKFVLTENPAARNAGVFSGNIYLDVVKNEDYGYQLWFNTKNETRRGGILFDGMWTSNKNQSQKPLLAARDLFMFANDILENFSYGEREIEINEKYRAIGWDDYWENDEWWAAGEKQQMSIWGF